MEQFKFSLGPYEIFASIIGGIPLVLAGCLLYNPVSSLEDLVPIVQNNASIAIALVLLFISYILGSSVQSISWYYFLGVCKLFNENYRYLGNLTARSQKLLETLGSDVDLNSLDFEHRLILSLHHKTGIPERNSWLDARLTSYLREHNRQAALGSAELHMANHIMYRGWSFGCVVLSGVLFINLFRTPAITFEQWLLPFGALGFAYITFERAVRLKLWHNRELLLGFYFATLQGE
ncbi:MAG: hypothetical protein AAF152_21240 [Cyanobacteria bacterium P01_A01_bin.114]